MSHPDPLFDPSDPNNMNLEEYTNFCESLYGSGEYEPLSYISIWGCAAGDGVITDPKHMFTDPQGRRFHNRDCAGEFEQAEDYLCKLEGEPA